MVHKIECVVHIFLIYLFSSEAASNNHSLKDGGSDKLSSFDESESSGSKDLDTGKEKLWSGHLCQNAKNCSVVLTSSDPIVFNVSDRVIESINLVFSENKIKKSTAALLNELGHAGDIVYTEIKVLQAIFPGEKCEPYFIERSGAGYLETGN